MVPQEELDRIERDGQRKRRMHEYVGCLAGVFGATFMGGVAQLMNTEGSWWGTAVCFWIAALAAVVGAVLIVKANRIRRPVLQMMDAIERYNWRK